MSEELSVKVKKAEVALHDYMSNNNHPNTQTLMKICLSLESLSWR